MFFRISISSRTRTRFLTFTSYISIYIVFILP
ncbi:hypothetical protein VP424E501_P0085 [Vibrio phage 424E50-1]|nr:hypothetical protein VP424E501_P0085 [Vibrio phage 424E50-1]